MAVGLQSINILRGSSERPGKDQSSFFVCPLLQLCCSRENPLSILERYRSPELSGDLRYILDSSPLTQQGFASGL